jgi:predicted metal-dependent HD superfamily phosphohydrolase
MTILQERFCALWSRCLPLKDGVDPRPVYDDLRRRYTEPRRRYHTLDHITHCFQQLDMTTALMEDPDAVEMALWFHDAIYEPGACTNEQKSVELFGHIAQEHFLPIFIGKVCGLILVTMHRQAPEDIDDAFICDIDLSSFGLPWEQFLLDTKALREEQDHISDEAFYPDHLKFLNYLLKRPRIFVSDFFNGRYEQRARQNIERFIAQCKSEGLMGR